MDAEAAGSSSVPDGDSDDEVMLISDAIKVQDQLIEQVTAVLGNADDVDCTYPQGYMKRQPLYACLTCVPNSEEDFTLAVGICLACSYHCHDGHNLIELYTKRHFRCDCGNSKMGGIPCNLYKDKDDLNELNVYNHNFIGLYCNCGKPYPDVEDPTDDEMIQCIICEDWYHSRHLGVPPPANYAEVICETCVAKNDFLLYYDGLASTKVVGEETDAVVTIEDDEEGVKKEAAGDAQISTDVKPANGCTRPPTKSATVSAIFMDDVSWRERLCKCAECMQVYENLQVVHLVDLQDTIQNYEAQGKAKVNELIDTQEAKMAKSLGRVGMIEMASGMYDFKEQLTAFFKEFQQSNRVIRVQDVEEFFSQLMQSRKRQKLDIPPYFCR